MGRQRQPTIARRKSSTPHYQTFPTPPPKSRGQPPSTSPSPSFNRNHHGRNNSDVSNHAETPLPTRQLVILAIISLSEQTALNSISPYLPLMASSFPEVDPSQVGVYVGTIASSYAFAQFATNFFWGWLSDRIGRKPIILFGTLLTAACFVAFGFCRTLGQAITVQVLMGLVNGNQGVVSTCLGEITDRSNQSRAFTYLPVVYGLGGITGPIVGGLLVSKNSRFSMQDPYPFLTPNLVAAAVLIFDMILTMIFLDESLEEAKRLPPLGRRVENLFSWVWQFASSSRPTYLKTRENHRNSHMNGDATTDVASDEEEDSASDAASHAMIPRMVPERTSNLSRHHILNRNTLLLLITYAIFQFSNISYNSLYPIFGQAPPPTGRALSPKEIGISLAFAAATTIFFQIGIFGKLRDKMGNKITYRGCLLGIVLAYILTPLVGYKNATHSEAAISIGKGWLYVELGFVLLVRALAAVGCLTSALLLVRPIIHTLSVLLTLPFTDHQLGPQPLRARHPQRPRPNPLGGWPRRGTRPFWEFILARDARPAEGRIVSIWRLRWNRIRGFSDELWDTRRWPGGGRVG